MIRDSRSINRKSSSDLPTRLPLKTLFCRPARLLSPPGSLIVLGGGAVALELGQFFARLRTKVTILQRRDTLHSEMDEDVGCAIKAALIDEGIEVVTDVQLLRVTCETTGIVVWAMKDGRERSYVGQEILQGLDRQPNIEGLRLDLAEGDNRRCHAHVASPHLCRG